MLTTIPRMTEILVAALYQFVALPDFRSLRQPIMDACHARGIRGSLLLAPEGINGTLAGSPEAVGEFLDELRRDDRLQSLEARLSYANSPPFSRLKVKLKQEIVTMGTPGVDPTRSVGTYVEPEEWNRLLEDPEVVVVDTRNDYEVAIGSFRGARNPGLGSFREFPAWLRGQFGGAQPPAVAMFCTGGIRCEKSTAFLRGEGLDDVYHLKGGILGYLERVPPERSLWEGACFVFDERVSVGHGLVVGEHELCRACRWPVDRGQREDPTYVPGVSCPHCIERTTPEQKRRFTNRMRQVALARERGEEHLKVARQESI
jgi:UPF0176 protein